MSIARHTRRYVRVASSIFSKFPLCNQWKGPLCSSLRELFVESLRRHRSDTQIFNNHGSPGDIEWHAVPHLSVEKWLHLN